MDTERIKKKCGRSKIINEECLFDGLTSRLDTTEQRIFELDNISKESLKTKRQRGQRLKNKTEYPSTVRQLQKV